jgi:Flp pilus assembly pilin Flp
MGRGARYWKDERGASAAEFALVLVPFLALIFGIIGLSLLIYANATLQYAAEDAARCASVNANCGDPVTHALSVYKGPAISPVFHYTYDAASACGHIVTGSATYPLDAVVVNISVPLSASACFP